MKRLFNTSSEIFFVEPKGQEFCLSSKKKSARKISQQNASKVTHATNPQLRKRGKKMRRNTAVCPCSIWPSLGIALRYYPQQRTHSALLFASTIDTYKVVYFPMDTNEELPPAEL